MPTIEVTPEQAAALARGENVTIAAPKLHKPLRNYIVVFETGNVYEFECPERDAALLGKRLPVTLRGRHRLVRAGQSSGTEGTVYGYGSRDGFGVVVEVSKGRQF